MQPFLTPVSPAGSDILATALLPFGYVLAILRTALIVVLGVVYALSVGGVCMVLVSGLTSTAGEMINTARVETNRPTVSTGIPWINSVDCSAGFASSRRVVDTSSSCSAQTRVRNHLYLLRIILLNHSLVTADEAARLRAGVRRQEMLSSPTGHLG